MKRTLLNILVVLSLAVAPAAAFSGVASAACPTGNSAKEQVLKGVNATGGTCSGVGVTGAFGVAVSVLSFVAGALAIIMIIYSGLKYITSGGDASKVSAAKTTLIYALIGLAVAVLAQVLVRLVVTQAETSVNNICATDDSKLGTDPTCKKKP